MDNDAYIIIRIRRSLGEGKSTSRKQPDPAHVNPIDKCLQTPEAPSSCCPSELGATTQQQKQQKQQPPPTNNYLPPPPPLLLCCCSCYCYCYYYYKIYTTYIFRSKVGFDPSFLCFKTTASLGDPHGQDLNGAPPKGSVRLVDSRGPVHSGLPSHQ